MVQVCLARIDDRLIHGQVATVWTKATGVERIFVVSDEVAKDPLQTFLLGQAVPPGLKAHVLSIEKMAKLFQEPLLEKTKVMLLFTQPTDIVALIKQDVFLPVINIGGMRFTRGRKMLTHFVSLDQQDIEAFKYLKEQGILLEIQKVPTERKVDLFELLQKEKWLD